VTLKYRFYSNNKFLYFSCSRYKDTMGYRCFWKSSLLDIWKADKYRDFWFDLENLKSSNFYIKVSKDSQNLYIQDKFGRSRLQLVASAIDDVHSLRIQQRLD